MGLAIKAIKASGLFSTWHGLDHLAKTLRTHADGIEREIAASKALIPSAEAVEA